MKRAVIITGVILIGVAYVLGFWPQYQKVQMTRQQLEQANGELAGSQARNGLYRLQHELLAVIRQSNQKNYGQASALSTIRPRYITTTSSAISAMTPRSCVMNMIAIPISFCNNRMSLRICASVVTSRAVVGSSAMSSFGRSIIAMAIIARCRIPPES